MTFKTEIQVKNHIITADEPESVGGQNLGLTPTELLESSGCMFYYDHQNVCQQKSMGFTASYC